ncbi:MAG: crotonase/enoyl-CoA hydratase family protein [Myxococcales bacterium]|nr:crotonase/enoyl-CoA hydratase family protein [Myxococcales bacterium]
MTDALQFEIRDSIALMRLDDGKANALSFSLIEAAIDCLPRALAEAKALVVLGRPGRFSAGFDLKVMMAGPAAAGKLLAAGAELFMRLYEHPQPVVAGVTGHAIAGGVLLSACCDLRIGARGDFKIGLNEVSVGIPVPILAHALASDRLDPRRVTESVLFAKLYDPEGAVAAGWLDRVADADAVEAEAIAAATELAKLPKDPYAKTKASLRRQTIDHVRATLASNIAGMTN